MQTSESISEIAGAMVLAQQAMLPLIKDSNNPFFKSKYADLQAVTEACYPALQANSICVMQSAESLGALGINIKTRLIHKSGQFIETECAIPPAGQDPQKYGSAVTYGRRYGLQAAVGLAAIDDDGESAMNRNATKPAAQPETTPTPSATNNDPAVVEKITSVFWQQTTLAGLNEMMALAKTKGYGTHKDVVSAYDELKVKLA
jgi:hypothetical protein